MSKISLSTDYLIVGAGAMGMSFLEELITTSKDVEAIIVDSRSAPGGHWNHAYPFVRLHQPALTYGVNSRTLGAGGPDLASKALILQHFELAMKDLVATGRVKFFPQCKYLGDGKIVSLLDESLKYEVEIKAKFVDATCTTTHVPATTKPNYKVSEGVNLVPINGLANISKPYPHYLVIGGGKTGIDAVLFLLDHGVTTDKISWVVPNDSWFWDRHFFALDDGNMSKKINLMLDCITDEEANTQLKALISCENGGLLHRLDKNFIPTRYRAATVSHDELKKLKQVQNIIRKGRIASVEPGKLIFQSGEEMEIDCNTLHVDCSTNSILFPPPKKVFDGKSINVQFIRLPPPSQSANIIAAMELKFPHDEEKKNSVCHVLKVPSVPKDFFANFHSDDKTNNAALEVLGFKYQRKRRSFAIHHVQFFDMIKMIFALGKRQKAFKKKLELLMEEEQDCK